MTQESQLLVHTHVWRHLGGRDRFENIRHEKIHWVFFFLYYLLLLGNRLLSQYLGKSGVAVVVSCPSSTQHSRARPCWVGDWGALGPGCPTPGLTSLQAAAAGLLGLGAARLSAKLSHPSSLVISTRGGPSPCAWRASVTVINGANSFRFTQACVRNPWPSVAVHAFGCFGFRNLEKG